jgi:sulfate permease, SulP family
MSTVVGPRNPRDAAATWHQFVPKLVSVLRQGYGFAEFRHDLLAGLTVAVVALPLAMALAIASGTTPEKGLHTAIIAGFLISALGGSRVQIGGPTAAFIPVVFVVIETHGYGGMILCTFMAGLMLIVAGLMRLGTLMKFMPQPVITGFTAGIAVSIFSSQVKDLFGLSIERLPAEFLARWQAYFAYADTFNIWALGLALIALVSIILMRRWRPHWPGFLLVVLLSSLAVSFTGLPVETIGSRFGEIPSALPGFALPSIPFDRIPQLLPSAFTIAFLAGVESLLSAVVADGMTGGRHRSNAELVAQGIANCGSAMFGGLPATGAIARTATNVRAGARSPVSGMLHALFLLGFMVLAAGAMKFVPLAALAAILLVVAWNMAEIEHFKHLWRGPRGDRLVLLLTFALTVMFDLTIAIEAGVVLAAFLFMHRMAEVVAIESGVPIISEDGDEQSEDARQRERLPAGVEVFQFAGPLFFAVANRLDSLLDAYVDAPRVLILRMRLVPLIDASGVHALQQFLKRCHAQGTRVILSGLQAQPRKVLHGMGVEPGAGLVFAENFDAAIELSLAYTATPERG